MREVASDQMNDTRSWRNSERCMGILMAGPAMVGILVFVAIPFLAAIGLSFSDLRIGSPLPTRFVGLQQYERVLSDPSFVRALANNTVFAVVVVPVQTTLALAMAVALNRRLAGIAIFRTAFFMPVVFPMALVAVVWQLIYAPGPNGPLNAVVSFCTFDAVAPIDFLHDPIFALPAIILLSVWQGVGFQMVVLLAGLQEIPQVLYESAEMDQAGSWARFLHITLPQLRNPLIFTALVTTILAFRLFDQVQILTRGGPIAATTTIMYEAVQTVFRRQQVGQACAITVLFFLIVLVITYIQRTLIRPEREVEQ